MLKLYKYRENFGNLGEVEGLFIEDDQQLNENIGQQIYFNHLFNLNYDISTIIDYDIIIEISDDQDLIKLLLNTFKSYDLCGINPMSYIQY